MNFIKRIIRYLSKFIFPLVVFWWKLTKPKSFGVRIITEDKMGRILLVKLSYIHNGAWVFPGGKIEKNEEAADAAKRELWEEVGIRVKSVIEIGQYRSDKYGKDDTVTVFFGVAENTNIKISELEISEARWFELSEIPNFPPNNAKAWSMYQQYKNHQI